MPFILHNVTRSRISFALRPTFDTEGMPNWRVKKEARRDTQWVNIEPHCTVDLCLPPWNQTYEQASQQVEVKAMLNRGHVRLVSPDGDTFVEPKPVLTLADSKVNYAEKENGIQRSNELQDSPGVAKVLQGYEQVVITNSNEDLPKVEPVINDPERHDTDRYITPDDLVKKIPLPPGSNPTFPPEAPTNPEAPIPKRDCPKNVHDFTKGSVCPGCGVSQLLLCSGCGYVGKNSRSLQMHQKTCKTFQASKQMA
jgi:hypothetical protein